MVSLSAERVRCPQLLEPLGGAFVVGGALAALSTAQNGALLDGTIRALYCAVLVALAIADLRTRAIPNSVVYPALGGVLLIAILDPSRSLAAALGGIVLASGPFLMLFLLVPGSIGGGDVKMAALVGGATAVPGVITALLVGTVGGALVAGGVVVRQRQAREKTIPYGPFLALGAIVQLAL